MAAPVWAFRLPTEGIAVIESSKPSHERPRDLFFGFFGAVSAVAVALTVVAIPVIVYSNELRHLQTHLFWLAAVGALPIGFLTGRNNARRYDEAEQVSLHEKATIAALAMFHLGAMVVFTITLVRAQQDFLGIFLGWSEWAFFRLETLVLAYTALRIWTLLAQFSRRRFGFEPWFFVGLYFGTFPALFDAMMSIDGLRWTSPVLGVPSRLLGFPGQITLSAFCPELIPHNILAVQGVEVLANSLTWGFLFMTVDFALSVRRKSG